MVRCWISSAPSGQAISGHFLAVARDNFDLTKYLIGQVLPVITPPVRRALQEPIRAPPADWQLEVAGLRDQIMQPGSQARRLSGVRNRIEFPRPTTRWSHCFRCLAGSPAGGLYLRISVLELCFKNALTKRMAGFRS